MGEVFEDAEQFLVPGPAQDLHIARPACELKARRQLHPHRVRPGPGAGRQEPGTSFGARPQHFTVSPAPQSGDNLTRFWPLSMRGDNQRGHVRQDEPNNGSGQERHYRGKIRMRALAL
jgi:hypothetical protein